MASLLRQPTRVPISGRSESGFGQLFTKSAKAQMQGKKGGKTWGDDLRVISLIKKKKKQEKIRSSLSSRLLAFYYKKKEN